MATSICYLFVGPLDIIDLQDRQYVSHSGQRQLVLGAGRDLPFSHHLHSLFL